MISVALILGGELSGVDAAVKRKRPFVHLTINESTNSSRGGMWLPKCDAHLFPDASLKYVPAVCTFFSQNTKLSSPFCGRSASRAVRCVTGGSGTWGGCVELLGQQ